MWYLKRTPPWYVDGGQALFLLIRRRLKEEKEKSVVYKSTWYDLVRYMQAPITDTSPTLPDAAYDTRNQGRVVSHSELSLLSACVRLYQLREVHHSLTLPAARGSSQLAAIAESLTGTKIKNFFIVVIIPKPFLKFPDKLIGKGCPTTGVLSMWNEKQRIASLHLAETLRPTALPHDLSLIHI